MRILYIEDNETHRKAFQDACSSHPEWDIVLSARGDEGRAQAIAEDFDAYLIDWNLPGSVGGTQIADDIAALKDRPPVMIITAFDSELSSAEINETAAMRELNRLNLSKSNAFDAWDEDPSKALVVGMLELLLANPEKRWAF